MLLRLLMFLVSFLVLVVALVVQLVGSIVATFLTASRPAVRILTMPLRVLKHPPAMSLVAFSWLMRSAALVLVTTTRATSGACTRLVNILVGRPAASANHIDVKGLARHHLALRETGLRGRQLRVLLTRLWDLPSVGVTSAG